MVWPPYVFFLIVRKNTAENTRKKQVFAIAKTRFFLGLGPRNFLLRFLIMTVSLGSQTALLIARSPGRLREKELTVLLARPRSGALVKNLNRRQKFFEIGDVFLQQKSAGEIF